MKEQEAAIKCTGTSDIGLFRTTNEDNFLIINNFTGIDNKNQLGFNAALIAVADGMGGHNAGEVASSLAISAINNYFWGISISLEYLETEIKAILESSIRVANEKLKEHALLNPQTKGMGTTIVIGLIIGKKAYLSWCGDSRAYLYNLKSGLSKLTHDHNELEEYNIAKFESESGLFDYPLTNRLTKYLGDFVEDTQPDSAVVSLHAGDNLLLCSDGLNNMLSDQLIGSIMHENPHIDNCKMALIQTAIQAGGYDNITVVLAEILR